MLPLENLEGSPGTIFSQPNLTSTQCGSDMIGTLTGNAANVGPSGVRALPLGMHRQNVVAKVLGVPDPAKLG